MDDEMARELIRKKKWKELQKFDQLKKEQHRGVFQGWKEGDIEFAPTYKYSVELGNRYTGDKHAPFNPNTGEKRRTPAWFVHLNFKMKFIVFLVHLICNIYYDHYCTEH